MNNKYICSIVYFDYNHSFDKLQYDPTFYNNEGKMYKTMCDVLIKSIKKNIPHFEIDLHNAQPPNFNNFKGFNTKPSWASNIVKLEIWNDLIQKSNTGDKIALLDCDTLVTKDFSDVFNNDFDVAFTDKPEPEGTFNGGVIFVNVNDASKEFFNIFLKINYKMLEDKEFHEKYRKKYSGMNQSAMGYLYELYSKDNKYILKVLPGKLYNQAHIEHFETGEIGYIIHYINILRYLTLVGFDYTTNPGFKYSIKIKKLDNETKNILKKFVDIWHEYENMNI